MKQAVIVDCVRTPIGRAHKEKGVFREVRSRRPGRATVVEALVDRTGIDPDEIEDVVMGNTQQQGEQGFNVARVVGLMAGLPLATGGTTVNRLCGSSLQAINQASHAIMAGSEDVQIVGGLEHMQHIPMDPDIDLNPKLFHRTSKGAMMMGFTAEFLAQTQGISREEQDDFALRSHQLAAKAHAAGEFRREIIPIWGRDEAGNRMLVDSRPVRSPRRHGRIARRAQAGLHARHGHCHGRQQLAAERRRRGAVDHVGRKGQGAAASSRWSGSSLRPLSASIRP